MAELWENFTNWLTTTGFDNIINWLLSGGLGTIAIILSRSLRKAQTKEIIAKKTSQLVSSIFEDSVAKLKDYINDLQKELLQNRDETKVLNQKVEKLTGALVLMLSNAKISPNAKKQVLELAKNNNEVVSEKVQEVHEIVNEIIETVEKEIVVEEKEEPIKESELDILIKEVGV